MSEKAPRMNMTDEAQDYRQKFNGRTNKDMLGEVDDLVGDRFQVTKNDRLQNKAGVTAMGADGQTHGIGGRFEHQSQLDDVVAFEDQIRLGMKAKEVIPALTLVDAALASAEQRNQQASKPRKINQLSIIRRTLVISKTLSAKEVGNMSDEDISQLLEYARIAQKQAEAEGQRSGTGNPLEVTSPDAPALDAVVEGDQVTSPDAPAQDAVVEGAEVTAPDAPAQDAVVEQENTANLERIETDLASARSEWAKLSSKRQRRTFDRRIEGYNDAKNRYNQLVQERGRALLADELAQTENATEKNALVIAYLANEQNELRELVKHESDMKFPVRFANWMNRGSRKARLAKGLAIGLAAGLGGSLLAGAAGVGVLAGSAVVASRFVRGYTARHTEGMGKLDVEKATKDASYRTRMYDGDEFENSASIFESYFENDSKKEQKKRRTAVAWGVGSIAVGALAGHALHLGIDHIAGWTDHNGLGGHPFADHQPNHQASGGSHTPSGGGHDVAPPAAPKPELHDLLNAHDTYNVHPGEGWDETMKDMGIPEDKWAEVLKDAGPKLHDQHWAYFDNAHHEWRISKPGHLSEAAVRTLKEASARHGFSFR